MSNADLTEAVAADVHQAWIDAKLTQGVTSRPSSDGIEQMVPYAELPDHLQELDRATVRAVFASPTLVDHLAARPSADTDTLRRVRDLLDQLEGRTLPMPNPPGTLIGRAWAAGLLRAALDGTR